MNFSEFLELSCKNISQNVKISNLNSYNTNSIKSLIENTIWSIDKFLNSSLDITHFKELEIKFNFEDESVLYDLDHFLDSFNESSISPQLLTNINCDLIINYFLLILQHIIKLIRFFSTLDPNFFFQQMAISYQSIILKKNNISEFQKSMVYVSVAFLVFTIVLNNFDRFEQKMNLFCSVFTKIFNELINIGYFFEKNFHGLLFQI